MNHTKHYWRVAFLIIGGFILLLIVRGFLLPSSFGEYGFYRGDNVQEQMKLPVKFAKPDACADCHDEQAKLHSQSKHKSVQCQNCHAPLSVHMTPDGDLIEKMPINRSPKLCLRCHRSLPSRPSDFPQIEVQKHLQVGEQSLSSGVCLPCHQPHDPTPK